MRKVRKKQKNVKDVAHWEYRRDGHASYSKAHYPWQFVEIFIEVQVKHKQVTHKKLSMKAIIVDKEEEMADGEDNE